jgi:O-antigen/teichoic acid export membrane protein
VTKIIYSIRNPLYVNSFFLVASRLLNLGGGFVFWLLAAKYYSIENIGTSTTLISSLSLIILISAVGFDFSLIRYINLVDQRKAIETSITITTIFAIIITVLYLLFIDLIAEDLAFILHPIYSILFIAFASFNSLFLISGASLKATREVKYFFYQNVILNLRIIFLIPLSEFGSFGIVAAFGLATIFSSLYALFLIRKKTDIGFSIDKQYLKKSFYFSSANYLSNILNTLPSLVFPILILNTFNETETAKYYIAFAIGNLPLIVADALGTSLFIQGSHGENLRKNTIKSVITIYLLLTPTIIFLYCFGDLVLGIYGEKYINAYNLLKILAITCFFIPVYSIFIPIQNIRMKTKSVFKLNILKFVLLMTLSYFLLIKYGIVGIGYSWLITHIILSFSIALIIKSNSWNKA